MKRFLSLGVALACFATQSAFCDQKIEAASWQKMEKFDPTALSKTLGDHVGQLVAVQFNFRGKDIRHIKPNWYAGSIWQPDLTAKKKFSNVRVLVAKKDIPAFKSITANATSRARLTVYGRVERDADNNFFFVRAWGCKAAIDSSGDATVTW
jgi:hypothetical protein